MDQYKVILSILFSVFLSGCSAHGDPIQVEPVVFSHADEMVRNEDFIILADRRVFTVIAFMNACGYDKQFDGIPMHPMRIRVREAIRLKAEAHPDVLTEWKEYYRRKALPYFFYMDYALSLCDDYPFRRIRPDSELVIPPLAEGSRTSRTFSTNSGKRLIWSRYGLRSNLTILQK